MVVKRAIKRTSGWAAVLMSAVTVRPLTARACILVYHRISNVDFTDPRIDNWNVTPKTFERQIHALSKFAEFVPLSDLPARLSTRSVSDKPPVCLTFDDGYANFATRALPVLRHYGACATVFVPTRFVGSTKPLPFDRWSQENLSHIDQDAWRPINWDELERCLASGLVSVGSHSHRHLDARRCSPAQVLDEAQESLTILSHRIGAENLVGYAYPYGSTRLGQVTQQYIQAVRTAGYRLAVSTDLGLADPKSDPYCLPRVEAHTVDSPAVLRAKLLGVLCPYYLADRLRTAKRR